MCTCKYEPCDDHVNIYVHRFCTTCAGTCIIVDRSTDVQDVIKYSIIT